MTRALILSEHDPDAWGERYTRGEVPAPLPYGVNALADELGWTLTGSRRAVDPRWSRLRDVVEHRAGFPVEQTLRGAGDVRRSDVVLALLERQGAAASTLRQRRVPPYRSTPLVVWSCWLADDLRSADPDHRQRLKRRFDGADLITHLSRHETEVFTDLGISEDRLFPVTYGVSHDYYVPGDGPRDIELLAVGQDRGRDYRTLFAAVRGTDLVLDVVCKPENLTDLDVPDNVRLHGVVPLTEYRALLQRAQVVVVPTRDLAYPTGSSVALESASSGACVAVTGTRAMRDYFIDTVDSRLVGEGDVEGWRALLAELRSDAEQRERLGAAARKSVEARFNARHMWTELAGVMTERGII
ncbi:glycosyltransferase [Nocardioides hwasunensis]|uniref:Glycosyltransferase n=1 Tax=Nocardioides hwasunensis TaxID=397258 RepID=A0ABR8MS77_9ACTN|nr:glycosyltransferase [Nocardioides hwasunensis]MBD3916999.1 glycosyltransferase [Nocardioides hwasunensis]